jgi:hypothetical protein
MNLENRTNDTPRKSDPMVIILIVNISNGDILCSTDDGSWK